MTKSGQIVGLTIKASKLPKNIGLDLLNEMGYGFIA